MLTSSIGKLNLKQVLKNITMASRLIGRRFVPTAKFVPNRLFTDNGFIEEQRTFDPKLASEHTLSEYIKAGVEPNGFRPSSDGCALSAEQFVENDLGAAIDVIESDGFDINKTYESQKQKQVNKESNEQ